MGQEGCKDKKGLSNTVKQKSLRKKSEKKCKNIEKNNKNENNNKKDKMDNKKTPVTKQSIPCLYTNTDCLTNKMRELKVILNDLVEKPLIIGITEVKPKNQRYVITKAEISLPDYDMFHCNLQNNKGRGIVLYVHKCLRAIEKDSQSDYEESVWAEIKLKGKDKLLVGCIYRSPSSLEQNSKNLNSLLMSKAREKYTHFLIMGDFNYPAIDWKSCTTSKNIESKEFQFIETLRDIYMYQHITEPTRGRGTDEPSTLDLIMTNEIGMIPGVEISSPIGKSDHSVIIFTFLCYWEMDTQKRIKKLYNKADIPKMKEMLTLDWEDEFSGYENNVNGKWAAFRNKLIEVENTCIPKKVISQNTRNKCLPLDEKTRMKIRKKHRCWQRYMETKDGSRYREFCRLRNQVRNLTRKAQRVFEKQIAKDAKKNPKAFWSYVKAKSKTRDGVSDLEKDDGTLTENDQEKAEALSKCFSSVFTQENMENMPEIEQKHISHLLTDLEITRETILKKIKALKVNKSPGPDCIHPKILVELSEELATPLLMIFEQSLQSKKLPDEWKWANISAIFKKGSRKDPLNYRPVSLTSIVCKIMEQIIRDHIIEHMRKNKLFSNKQFGFISGRSTTIQLLNVLDKWTKKIDEGFSLDVIYMDFMKAFDKVPHQRLLAKVKSYGIVGKVHGWIQDFLENRKQCVVVNGCTSSSTEVTSGIPQGSVLGPLLFVIYINDLPENVKSDVYMFADDTKIFRTIKTSEDNTKLQRDLEKLQTWSENWQLKFHPHKCKVMTVGKAQNYSYRYHMKEEEKEVNLHHVEFEKDIGLVVDRKLNFEKHISEKVNKANSIVGLIRRTYEYLDEESFLLLYKALVRPHIEYANACWSPYKRKDIDEVENVQRRATRLIPSLRHLDYEQRLRKLKLPTLVYRRLRGDMIELYKIHKGLYDEEIVNFLTPGISNNTRGHVHRLYLKYARLNVRKNFFGIRCVSIWNNLPKAVVNAPSVKSFEGRLDKFWSREEIKYNHKAEFVKGNRMRLAEELDIEAELT